MGQLGLLFQAPPARTTRSKKEVRGALRFSRRVGSKAKSVTSIPRMIFRTNRNNLTSDGFKKYMVIEGDSTRGLLGRRRKVLGRDYFRLRSVTPRHELRLGFLERECVVCKRAVHGRIRGPATESQFLLLRARADEQKHLHVARFKGFLDWRGGRRRDLDFHVPPQSYDWTRVLTAAIRSSLVGLTKLTVTPRYRRVATIASCCLPWRLLPISDLLTSPGSTPTVLGTYLMESPGVMRAVRSFCPGETQSSSGRNPRNRMTAGILRRSGQ